MWRAISSADTVAGITGLPLWKVFSGAGGAAAAAIVSFLSSVPPWLWFLLVMGGIGGGLFIANEFASLRWRRRPAQIELDKPGTSGQGGEGGVAIDEGLAGGGGGGGGAGSPGGRGGDAISANDDAEKVGTLAELVAGDNIQRSYGFAANERQHLKELWHWREAQRADLQQYIKITISDVDCSHAHRGTPYIAIWFHVRNYHGVGLKIVKLEPGEGEVGSHPLPPLDFSKTASVNRGSETQFEIRLYIHGTDIPDAIKDLAKAGGKVAWRFPGTWKGKIYGAEQTIKTDPLSWSGIPNVDIPTTNF